MVNNVIDVGDMVMVNRPIMAMTWRLGPGGEHSTTLADLLPIGEMLLVIDNFEINPNYFEVWWISKRQRVILPRSAVTSLERLS